MFTKSHHLHFSPVESISDFQTRGYDHDFSLIGGQLFCAQRQQFCKTQEFDLIGMRYVRRTRHNPFEFMIYAIEVPDWSARGILMMKGKDHGGLFPEAILHKLGVMRAWRGDRVGIL